MEECLLNRKVVATDVTTVTINGKQNYVRNFSTQDTVVYHAMQKKAIPALEEMDFLGKYSGIIPGRRDQPV